VLDDRQLSPHGTSAAYKRHRRHGEKACESCLQAERRRSADYREKTGAQAWRERYQLARAAGFTAREAKNLANNARRFNAATDRLIADIRRGFMNAAEITALCTGIPAIITAVTALIHALQAKATINQHANSSVYLHNEQGKP
jgi:hypothetical protein